MLHWAIFLATRILEELRDKLQERLPSVTAPLAWFVVSVKRENERCSDLAQSVVR